MLQNIAHYWLNDLATLWCQTNEDTVGETIDVLHSFA